MSKQTQITASTLAQIAGNILSGTPMLTLSDNNRHTRIAEAMVWAREIAVAAVDATEADEERGEEW